MDENYEFARDLGRIYAAPDINENNFTARMAIDSIKALGIYSKLVDYCNIKMSFKENEVEVIFKAVHVSEPTAETVRYSKVVFYS